jgi:hypothetical protein
VAVWTERTPDLHQVFAGLLKILRSWPVQTALRCTTTGTTTIVARTTIQRGHNHDPESLLEFPLADQKLDPDEETLYTSTRYIRPINAMTAKYVLNKEKPVQTPSRDIEA